MYDQTFGSGKHTIPADAPKPTISAWSYSRLEKWTNCPRSAYYKFVLRMPEPQSEAMLRGLQAHSDCAKIYSGLPITVPSLLSPMWVEELSAHKRAWGVDLEAEVQIAFDGTGARCDWFAKQTVFRCAFDGLAANPSGVVIYEHKTGKPRESHAAQMELYAINALRILPGVQVVQGEINYLDFPPKSAAAVRKFAFNAEDLFKAGSAWQSRAEEMMADTQYPTRAGPLCRWCYYRKSIAGPCEQG